MARLLMFGNDYLPVANLIPSDTFAHQGAGVKVGGDKGDYLRRSALVQAHHRLHAHGMIRDCTLARRQKPRFQNQGFQAKVLIDIHHQIWPPFPARYHPTIPKGPVRDAI